jgi:hypothetical protein
MKTKSLKIIMILSITLPFFDSVSADYITGKEACEINWSRGYIKSSAKSSIDIEENGSPVDHYSRNGSTLNGARLESYGRAREEAVEKLIDTVIRMRMDSSKTVQDVINDEAFTRKRLSEAVHRAVKIKDYPAGFNSTGCEAKIKFGAIIASLPFSFPSQDIPSRDDTPISTDYTGLIIDCRGLNIEPMLFPAILDENGLEIYSRFHVDGTHAYKKGIVSYCFNEDEAVRTPRAGRHPYYAIALKSVNGSPVLSDRDTRKILSGRNTANCLKKCGVIFILNKIG